MNSSATPGLDGHYDLTDSPYSELKLLEGDVKNEIARRDALIEEEKRRVAEDEAALRRVANEHIGVWVEHERVPCGKKECRCSLGKVHWHGPYWYLYVPSPSTDSGRTSVYVGRKLTDEAAEILATHKAKRRAKDELLKVEFRPTKTADELAGLYPEEVYPEDFEEEELAAVRRKRERETKREKGSLM